MVSEFCSVRFWGEPKKLPSTFPMTKEEAKTINSLLALRYGSLHEQPRFRLVWSTDLFEVREGDFKVNYGKLNLGLMHDTRRVLKYSYCPDRWILEEIIYSHLVPKELVTQGKVSYEPIYVFWTGDNGDYQEPDLFHIEQICYFRVNRTLKKPMTDAEIAEKKLEHDRLNVAKIREVIDEALPDTAHAIVHGAGVALGRGLKEVNEKVLHPTQQSNDANSNS